MAETMMVILGASLKDLGKKCFAFEVFDTSFIGDIMNKLATN